MLLISSYLVLFFSSYTEGNIYKFINNSKNRNFISFIFQIFTVVLLVILSLIPLLFKNDLNLLHELRFLSDKWFYALILFEIIGSILYRESYKIYTKNYTIVNMFMFSTIFLMPLYAFFMNKIVDLNQEITVLDNFTNSLINSMVLFIAFLIYFARQFKIKSITNIWILIALSICMLNCLYLSAKMMQTYHGPLFYVIIILLTALNFLRLSKRKKETTEINESKKLLIILLTLKSFMQYAYLKAISFIPVELVAIVRRVSQLLSGIIIDKKIPDMYETTGILIIIAVFLYNILF